MRAQGVAVTKSPNLSYEIYNVEHDGKRRVFVLPYGENDAFSIDGHPHKQDYRDLTGPQAALLASALKSYLPRSKIFKDDAAWDHAEQLALNS